MTGGMLPFDADPPVSVARERLFSSPAFKAHGGQHLCPCCGQNVKARYRRLNAGMAAILCWLTREWQLTGDWVDVHAKAPRFAVRSNEVSRLALWGLTETRHNANPEQRDSGLWRPTVHGRLFVEGRSKVPTHVRSWEGDVIGCAEETFTIHEALDGGKFDYEELMGRRIH